MEPLIQLRNLEKAFEAGGSKFFVLRRINIDIQQGEFVTFMGPSGAGKSHLARHLALARELNRAVVIHCRQAEADTVRMLRADVERHGPVRGVMHSFTGDVATAQACLAMGLCISFAGMPHQRVAGQAACPAAAC